VQGHPHLIDKPAFKFLQVSHAAAGTPPISDNTYTKSGTGRLAKGHAQNRHSDSWISVETKKKFEHKSVELRSKL
jgi:ribosomal protein L39E